MDGLVLVLLFVLALFGVPIAVIVHLFGRTKKLRLDIDALRERIHSLERAHPAEASPRLPAEAPSHAARTSEPAPILPAEAASHTVRTSEPASILPAEAVSHAIGTSEAAAPRPHDKTGGFRLQPEEPTPAHQEESLESRIGGRWLLNIGIAAIVVGVAYFEKLAIDNRWIGETARIVQGAILGGVLIYAGARFARRGYALYGQMLAGGGVAILYVSSYAAFSYYHLIGRPAAFAAMVGITALGALLADRHNSQGLAVLAVGGGFATPFLLPGTSDAQIGLFTYIGILTGGTVFLARRREWPLLYVVSYVSTLVTVAAWADRFYTPSKYLPTELFLSMFCAMFVAIARSCRRMEHGFSEFAAWFVWTAPVAYYAASLIILSDHPMPMLVWLICVALVSGVASVRAGTGVGLVLWLAAALPLLGWTLTHGQSEWLVPGIVSIAAIYAIALGAQLRAAGNARPLQPLDIEWLHLNALLMFAGAYFLLENTHLAATGPLGAAFAAWQGLLAAGFWRRDRDRAVHFTALAFTLLSIAIALQFDGPAVTVGWAAEGAAIAALGLRERRTWLRAGGALLFVVAVQRVIRMLLSAAPASHVVVLNPRAASALLVVALCYALAWFHRRDRDATHRAFAIGAAIIAAQLVSLVLLTSEIHAYWAVRNGALTRELMVSVTWALYATTLITIGFWRRYAIVRYFGIAVFGLTILKVFLGDLAELDRIYRVLSVIGLGITLLLTSYLYQRMRGTLRGNEPGE